METSKGLGRYVGLGRYSRAWNWEKVRSLVWEAVASAAKPEGGADREGSTSRLWPLSHSDLLWRINEKIPTRVGEIVRTFRIAQVPGQTCEDVIRTFGNWVRMPTCTMFRAAPELVSLALDRKVLPIRDSVRQASAISDLHRHICGGPPVLWLGPE